MVVVKAEMWHYIKKELKKKTFLKKILFLIDNYQYSNQQLKHRQKRE